MATLTQGTIFRQTASVTVGNTTTETTVASTGVGSLVIPANTLAVGAAFRITVIGTYDRATGTLTLRSKFGATTFCSTSAASPGAGNNTSFLLRIDGTVRTAGAGGTLFSNGYFIGVSPLPTTNTATTALDTTVANTLDISCQWSAVAAANTMTVQIITFELL